jgi:cytochrome d ubiquinol oxidase subunit II
MFDLNTLWFILIAILWTGFFFLEGFDFGVGMLLPFLGKKDEQRRAIINTIGPHWDGNEVWMLSAGGATFAAFPQWYATMFSGFYLAFFLLLVGLIIRGVAIEFRSKNHSPKWRVFWDWCICVGSFVPALLLGVTFANLGRGLPIDGNMMFTGNLITLLNPYGLLGGAVSVTVFLLHGAVFLSMKLEDELKTRVESLAGKLWLPVVILFTAYQEKVSALEGIIPLVSLLALLLAGLFIKRKRNGWAFILTSLNIILAQVTFFIILFPQAMISNTNKAFSLDIWNAASSPYTLKVMSIVAAIFVPIILGYEAYTYWTFRKRVSTDQKKLVY